MMKTLSVFLVVAIAACGGKKGGGEGAVDQCMSAVDKAYMVSADELKKAGIDGATSAKMKGITVNRCNADKWDPKVVQCLSDAKTYDDMLKCTDSLAAAQKTTWTNELSTVAPKAPEPPTGSGGSGDGSSAGSATGSGGSAAGSGSAAAPPKGAMNDSCKALGDTLAKAAACDKLPKPARAAYAQVASLTDAAQCKATETSIRTSAAATCGW